MATAMPAERLLTICEAPTVQTAMIKGDELGWPRLTDAETEEWRRSFVAYNGGSVDVMGWRQEKAGGVGHCLFGLLLVRTDTKHAHIPRQDLPVSWMRYRRGLAHRIIWTRMTRSKV